VRRSAALHVCLDTRHSTVDEDSVGSTRLADVYERSALCGHHGSLAGAPLLLDYCPSMQWCIYFVMTRRRHAMPGARQLVAAGRHTLDQLYQPDNDSVFQSKLVLL